MFLCYGMVVEEKVVKVEEGVVEIKWVDLEVQENVVGDEESHEGRRQVMGV